MQSEVQIFASLALSVAAVFISALNWLVNRANRLQARTNLLIQLRKEWTQLQGSWRICLGLIRGPSDYYSNLDDSEREFLSNAIDTRSGKLRQEVLLVRDFLGLCAHSLIAGNLRSSDLYAFLGPEVARHGVVIRSLCGQGARVSASVYQALPNGGYGTHLKTLAMGDLLWAELAKNGDLDAHQVLHCAEHKGSTGSGVVCRRRVLSLMRREEPVLGVIRGLRATWSLMYAEVLDPRSLEASRDPIEQTTQSQSIGGLTKRTRVYLKTFRGMLPMDPVGDSVPGRKL